MSSSKKPHKLVSGPRSHAKDMGDLLRANARTHRLDTVFSDFCEVSALSFSNAVDPIHRDAREKRYLEIVAKYQPEEITRFCQALAVLVEWLSLGMCDALGDLFMSLELGERGKGQFFTPYPVSSLMARMTAGDVKEQLKQQDHIALNEPACGAGGMVIAYAEAMLDQDVNYQHYLHATLQDIDSTAVHMAYVQLSLLHVPAIVIHGNSLAMTEWAHWVTPAHVLGGWDKRLYFPRAVRAMREVLSMPATEDLVSSPQEVSVPPAPTPIAESATQYVVNQRREQLALF
ncbi:hypothetical protein AE621_20880 [Acidovorax sp. SD340]|nr:hypothetical protein AE621_20880 [Acidovorax sp. SD340]